MKIKFIVYSSGDPYDTHARNLLKQASEQFDTVKHYQSDDIKDFKYKNQNLWDYNKGDGFWTWKPYIIKKELEETEEGEIIVYCDSRYIITNDLYSPIKKHFNENNDDFFVLKTHHFVSSSIQLELMWSKGDAFHLIGVDMNDDSYPYQIWSGFICLRKSKKTVSIINEWLEFSQDERIITDNPNIFQDNHHIFRENRHDQTVLSLVLKKNKIYMVDSELSNLLSGYPHSKLIHRVPNT